MKYLIFWKSLDNYPSLDWDNRLSLDNYPQRVGDNRLSLDND